MRQNEEQTPLKRGMTGKVKKGGVVQDHRLRILKGIVDFYYYDNN